MKRTIKGTPVETSQLRVKLSAFLAAQRELQETFTMFAEGKNVPGASLLSIDGLNVELDVPAKPKVPVNPAVRKKGRR